MPRRITQLAAAAALVIAAALATVGTAHAQIPELPLPPLTDVVGGLPLDGLPLDGLPLGGPGG